MTAYELRRKFLEFFDSKGHNQYPSGLLVPYDVTGRLDESLLFNGAGMVQFKPFFRGVATPPHPRLTTAQKCVRTGDIETVGDLTHLTFFEMLGNFSFGDYFKPEAIAYSWEFLTSPTWLGLDPKRLAFTVFSEDDVAYEEWSKHLSAAGIDPASRIFRLGEDTNYWPAGAFSSGPPGPCGPNSEMFYWTSNDVPPPGIQPGDYDAEKYLADEEHGLWLEIWNDVFIQYEWQGSLKNAERPHEGYQKEGMPELPFRSIDTGMGLERTTAVLSGYRSVYDTDLFTPIFRTLEQVGSGRFAYGRQDDRIDRAMRIIADHIRTSCFCIADGILPSNTGRGYVLRRLIRRAVIKGLRILGFDEPFFHLVYQGVAQVLGDHYRELIERRETIVQTLHAEEVLFRNTITRGMEMLEAHLAPLKSQGGVLEGELAFRLYDTYGFPLEVTMELCEEAGVQVDTEGYEAAMKEAQERSRQGSEMGTVYGGIITFSFSSPEGDKPTPTHFVGYETTQCPAQIVGSILAGEDGTGSEIAIALNQSPFYAESGGQVSDSGTIQGETFTLNVVDVIKQDGVFVHICEVGALQGELEPSAVAANLKSNPEMISSWFGQPVMATVDRDRRSAITRNHTATHLMHAALRNVLGGHVGQAGSLVSPDLLRFDFTHGQAMSDAQIQEVEQIVMAHILAAQPMLTYVDVPIDDARKMGAMALFGEKYADFVRVVQVGGMPPDEASFSRELCGGVHVRNTGEIGLFKIVHEASAASGIRRITAYTGHGALNWFNDQADKVRQAAEKLKSTPADVLIAIDKLSDQLRDERKKVERMRTQSTQSQEAAVQMVGSIELVVQKFEDMDSKEAAVIVDRLADGHAKRVVVGAIVADGKVQLVVKAGTEAVASGAHAGNIVKFLAGQLGGGGGGRPDFATAGGKNVGALDAALAAVPGLLE